MTGFLQLILLEIGLSKARRSADFGTFKKISEQMVGIIDGLRHDDLAKLAEPCRPLEILQMRLQCSR